VTILQQINGNSLQIVKRASRTIADEQRQRPWASGSKHRSRAFYRRPSRACKSRVQATRTVARKTRRDQDLASAAIRCAKRDTLRCAALRCTTFFCAARMMTGSASAMAVRARARSPAVIASSTLRTAPRSRERRALLTTVRRTLWRAAFFADFVLAMIDMGFCEGALIGAPGASVKCALEDAVSSPFSSLRVFRPPGRLMPRPGAYGFSSFRRQGGLSPPRRQV
jgi:hypothetical protein